MDDYKKVLEMTPIQEFVFSFMNTRAKQDRKISDKKMVGMYLQNKRLKMIDDFIINKFTSSHLLKKSGRIDFMLFLLEGYLKGTYPEYQTFNDYYNDLEKNK